MVNHSNSPLDLEMHKTWNDGCIAKTMATPMLDLRSLLHRYGQLVFRRDQDDEGIWTVLMKDYLWDEYY